MLGLWSREPGRPAFPPRVRDRAGLAPEGREIRDEAAELAGKGLGFHEAKGDTEAAAIEHYRLREPVPLDG